MNREDIIRMAREAGFVIDEAAQQHQPNCIFHTWHMIDEGLTRFAALVAIAERERVMQIAQSMKADLEAEFEKSYMDGVMAGAAAEREACAKVCDRMPDLEDGWRANLPSDCAVAIRARGNT